MWNQEKQFNTFLKLLFVPFTEKRLQVVFVLHRWCRAARRALIWWFIRVGGLLMWGLPGRRAWGLLLLDTGRMRRLDDEDEVTETFWLCFYIFILLSDASSPTFCILASLCICRPPPPSSSLPDSPHLTLNLGARGASYIPRCSADWRRRSAGVAQNLKMLCHFEFHVFGQTGGRSG